MHPKDADGMANSVDPDQTASSEAVWSWSALFAETYLSQYIEFIRYFTQLGQACNLRSLSRTCNICYVLLDCAGLKVVRNMFIRFFFIWEKFYDEDNNGLTNSRYAEDVCSWYEKSNFSLWRPIKVRWFSHGNDRIQTLLNRLPNRTMLSGSYLL